MAVLWWIGLVWLGLPVRVLAVLIVAVKFLVVASAVWAAYRLTDVVGEYFAARARAEGRERALGLRARLEAGEQSLLFLNRRGYAPVTICRACGHQIGCEHCDARMVEHRFQKRLVCHQCGETKPMPERCPSCDAEDRLAPVGPGVERLGEEGAVPEPVSLNPFTTRDAVATRYVLPVTHDTLYDLDPGTGAPRPAAARAHRWSPDGTEVVFTSDRSGGPQVYRVPVNGGTPERVTFEGSYNADASWSPDGRSIALISRSRGDQVAILDLDSRGMQTISTGSLNESPSYAPNGSMVVYAAAGGVLSVVAVDYDVQQRLAAQSGEVRDPAWSPFLIKRKP